MLCTGSEQQLLRGPLDYDSVSFLRHQIWGPEDPRLLVVGFAEVDDRARALNHPCSWFSFEVCIVKLLILAFDLRLLCDQTASLVSVLTSKQSLGMHHFAP